MDHLIRRAVMVALGLACGAAAAALLLPLLVILDPSMREAGGTMLIVAVLGGLFDLFGPTGPWLLSKAASLAWAFVLAVCAAPLLVSAAISELLAIRSLVWHLAAPAFIAAAAPWSARATDIAGDAIDAGDNSLETRLLVAFFLTGCAAGLVYWWIAGRNAGLRPEDE